MTIHISVLLGLVIGIWLFILTPPPPHRCRLVSISNLVNKKITFFFFFFTTVAARGVTQGLDIFMIVVKMYFKFTLWLS